MTQPGQVPKGGLAVLDHGDDPVVDLQPVSDVTAGDDTGLVPLDHCPSQWGPDGSSQAGDGSDVCALGDHQVDDGITQHLTGDLEGHGANAGYLAALALFDLASP
jgi:hypothetical protein